MFSFPSVLLCPAESNFPGTAIKYNDIQGPPTKFAVAMVTVGGFEQVVVGNIVLKWYLLIHSPHTGLLFRLKLRHASPHANRMWRHEREKWFHGDSLICMLIPDTTSTNHVVLYYFRMHWVIFIHYVSFCCKTHWNFHLFPICWCQTVLHVVINNKYTRSSHIISAMMALKYSAIPCIWACYNLKFKLQNRWRHCNHVIKASEMHEATHKHKLNC